jgi:hypothetical protein
MIRRLLSATGLVAFVGVFSCHLAIGVNDRQFVETSPGTGGQGATGGGGGTTVTPCTQVTDCPTPQSECESPICLGGVCGTVPVAAGADAMQQTAGDCQTLVCDGAGNTTTQNDDSDVPDDGTSCTDDACNSGAPEHTPLALGTSCSDGGGAVCDDAGACVQCNAIADCSSLPPDDECQARGCDAGSCASSYTAAGTAVTLQTTGDCKVNQCDGAGMTVSANADTDLPDDGNDCTMDVCTAGVPSNPNLPMGTTCAAGTCNDMGQCTGCSVGSDCLGTDTFCRTRTCTANVCGFSFTAAGTPLPVGSQTAADCLVLQCDGAGGIQAVADDSDLPVDDGNQCTNDVCQNGVVKHPPRAVDIPCSQGGGTVCDGNGDCVECNSGGQCADQGTVCQTATCMSKMCGLQNTADNTPAPSSAQTSGDCKVVLCDGAGGTKTSPDPADTFDDLNDCTDDICNGTMPSNPPSMSGTSCGSGGTCDGAGNCSTGGTGANGDPCTTTAECMSGFCVDGVCCDGACSALCMACIGSSTDGADGSCLPVSAGSDPNGECMGQDNCDGAGSCTGSGSGENGTPCSDGGDCMSGNCAYGVCCNQACTDACKSCLSSSTGSDDGNCIRVLSGTDPHNHCPALQACAPNGSCKAVNGQSCNNGIDCATAHCVDGFCCDADCLDICYACSNAKTGAADGSCAPIPNGQDPDMECIGGAGYCNGAGVCI